MIDFLIEMVSAILGAVFFFIGFVLMTLGSGCGAIAKKLFQDIR